MALACKDHLALGVAPWFDLEALEVGVLVDLYAKNGWLLRYIPFEWTRFWTSCAHRSVKLRDVRREFCVKVTRWLQRLDTLMLCPVVKAIFVTRIRCAIA